MSKYHFQAAAWILTALAGFAGFTDALRTKDNFVATKSLAIQQAIQNNSLTEYRKIESQQIPLKLAAEELFAPFGIAMGAVVGGAYIGLALSKRRRRQAMPNPRV